MTTRVFAIESYRGRWDLPDSDWPTADGRAHVFIQRYDLPEQPTSLPERFRSLAGIRLYLFGCHGTITGSTGVHVIHTVVEIRPGARSPTCHELHQSFARGDGVFFSTDDEHSRYSAGAQKVQPGMPLGEEFMFGSSLGAVADKQFKVFVQNEDYTARLLAAWVHAGRPAQTKKWLGERIRSDFHQVGRMPRWTEDEGDWPFVDADPMLFVAQTILPKNDVTQKHLAFNEMFYLFVGLREGRTVCKLYRQSVGTQTAEAHYRLEELMALYHSKPHDAQTLHKVVTEGDRFLHQHLLEQPRLPTAALTLLAQHAANKELRSMAAQRLRKATTG